MDNKYTEGTYIFGYYYSSEELNEINTNPIYKNTLIKAIIDLRVVMSDFKKELSNTIDRIINKREG